MGTGMNEFTSDALQSLLTHESWARKLALALVRDPDRADDLVQTVLVAAQRRPPKANVPVRGWFAKALRNQARYEARSRRNSEAVWVERARQAPYVPAADHSLCLLEQRQMLLAAVSELEEPYRSTITARFFEELQPRQIASDLEIPVKTVNTRLSRGLAMMREKLDRQHGGDRERWVLGLAPVLRIEIGRVTLGGSVASSQVFAILTGLAVAAIIAWAWLSGSPAAHRTAAAVMPTSDIVAMAEAHLPSVPNESDRREAVSRGDQSTRTLTVTAVDAISLRPSPEAQLQWWGLEQLGAEPGDIEAWLRRSELEERLSDPSGTLRTDSAGAARLPWIPGGVLVTAASEQAWGYLVLRDPAPEDYTIALKRDGDLRAFLTDDFGMPLIGGQVVFRVDRDDDKTEFVVATSRAPDGLAILRHARYLAPPCSAMPGASWTRNIYQLTPVVVGPSPILRVTCDTFEQPPPTLSVGATGSVGVDIYTKSGDPLQESMEARLVVGAHRNSVTVYQSNWVKLEGGRANFEIVSVNGPVAVLLRRPGDIAPRRFLFSKPRVAGTLASLEIFWEEEPVTLRGRLVRSGGELVASQSLRLGVERDSQGLIEMELVTDPTGGFSATFDRLLLPSIAGKPLGIVKIAILGADAAPLAVVRRSLGAEWLTDGVDLGTIEVVEAPVTVQGQVVDPDGRPLGGARLTLHQRLPPETKCSPYNSALAPALSDEKGRFVLRLTELVKPFEIRAQLAGYHADPTVISDNIPGAVVKMIPAGRLVGSLQMHASVRPGDIRLGLIPEGEEHFREDMEAVVNDEWNFSVDGLIPGTYSLGIFAGEGEGMPERLPVAYVSGVEISAGTVHRDERLDPLYVPEIRGITLLLKDAAGDPIKEFSIQCRGSRHAYALRSYESEVGSVRILSMGEPLSVSVEIRVQDLANLVLDGVIADRTIVVHPKPDIHLRLVTPEAAKLPPNCYFKGHLGYRFGPIDADGYAEILYTKIVRFDADGYAVVRSQARGPSESTVSLCQQKGDLLESVDIPLTFCVEIPEVGDASFDLHIASEHVLLALDALEMQWEQRELEEDDWDDHE